MNAVNDGFGKGFDNVSYDSEDFNMLKHLEESVYQFSGAKNYQELKLFTEALTDNGRLRTKQEHLQECKKIYAEYNERYHSVEYDTATGSAQMAARWIDFQRNAATMPLLKFVAVHDMRECPICRSFDGIVRPISDPFWGWAYPLLHFLCRCLVIQLTEGTETPEADLPSDELVPKMFRVNLAQERLAFPPDHPYFKGVPKKVLTQFVKNNLPKR